MNPQATPYSIRGSVDFWSRFSSSHEGKSGENDVMGGGNDPGITVLTYNLHVYSLIVDHLVRIQKLSRSSSSKKERKTDDRVKPDRTSRDGYQEDTSSQISNMNSSLSFYMLRQTISAVPGPSRLLLRGVHSTSIRWSGHNRVSLDRPDGPTS